MERKVVLIQKTVRGWLVRKRLDTERGLSNRQENIMRFVFFEMD